MSKIIFVTDLHHGGNTYRPQQDHYTPPLLSNLAIDFTRAINGYAEREKITTILNGGDLASHVANKDQHLENLYTIMRVVEQAQADVSTAIGNHEPYWHDDLHGLGFAPHGFKQTPDSDLFIFQPDIFHDDERTIYQYQNENTAPAYKQSNQSSHNNLIVLGHYAVDRNEEKFPYNYPVDNVYAYRDIHRGSDNDLFARMTDVRASNFHADDVNEPYFILGCFGHEHRFRKTVQDNATSLTMPSPIQEDPTDPSKPCGLFAVINIDDDTGKLSIEFKRAILNRLQPELSEVQDVPEHIMQSHYYRPTHGHQRPTILVA